MELEKIREFHELARTLNFTRAARSLHMSFSALSKHLRSLEEELGVPLVQRELDGRNVLTKAGQRFLDRTRPWLAEFDGIAEECRGLRDPSPPVRIHGAPSCVIGAASQLRRALEASGSEPVNFACVALKLPAREALDRGAADFACHYEPEPQVRWLAREGLEDAYGCIPLAPEHPCLIAGATSPLADRSSVALQELGGFQLIDMDDSMYNNWLKANTEIFSRYGHDPSIRVVHDLPLSGGAFHLGPRDLVLSTDKFARYYEDLDVEDVTTLAIEGFDAVTYPFLIYRRDTDNKDVLSIVAAREKVGPSVG